MAKTDRNSNLMKEAVGTVSLVTDYGDLPPLHPKNTELSKIIEWSKDKLRVINAGCDVDPGVMMEVLIQKLEILQKQH
jgi:hypothetical protein